MARDVRGKGVKWGKGKGADTKGKGRTPGKSHKESHKERPLTNV